MGSGPSSLDVPPPKKSQTTQNEEITFQNWVMVCDGGVPPARPAPRIPPPAPWLSPPAHRDCRPAGHRSIEPGPKLREISLEMEIIERQQFSSNWDALPKVVGRQIYPSTPQLFSQGHFDLNGIQRREERFSARFSRQITVSLGITAPNQRNYMAAKRSLMVIMAGKIGGNERKRGTGEQEEIFPRGQGRLVSGRGGGQGGRGSGAPGRQLRRDPRTASREARARPPRAQGSREASRRKMRTQS